MKEINNLKNQSPNTDQMEISCGNCWGHQEYMSGYVEKTIDHQRNRNENFISKFVKQYLKKNRS
ncbi:MAG: hypothetical protein P1U56_22435 [Saprospiraceae bacterium]|nr:hypothetical protein [Saprospiraceae bacterium]